MSLKRRRYDRWKDSSVPEVAITRHLPDYLHTTISIPLTASCLMLLVCPLCAMHLRSFFLLLFLDHAAPRTGAWHPLSYKQYCFFTFVIVLELGCRPQQRGFLPSVLPFCLRSDTVAVFFFSRFHRFTFFSILLYPYAADGAGNRTKR